MPVRKRKRGRPNVNLVIDRIKKIHENPNEELPADRLPNFSEILSYYFFLSSTASLFESTNIVGIARLIGEELHSLWQRCLPGIPMISDRWVRIQIGIEIIAMVYSVLCSVHSVLYTFVYSLLYCVHVYSIRYAVTHWFAAAMCQMHR